MNTKNHTRHSVFVEPSSICDCHLGLYTRKQLKQLSHYGKLIFTLEMTMFVVQL